VQILQPELFTDLTSLRLGFGGLILEPFFTAAASNKTS